ncbi:DUF3089 domain-containing protein [Sphingomicrobium clamense]|uniref:DUF3089 domain-containing protein n=1 Tax=Sphingomicrobium clamense TaxID=2851013 RepID=A0ABS6V8H7_9SPHN|nr:DUF3089 domain-containing protein [Sphingomicrobium sp. B8]MBW0145824.1 DUF3089 domain-containing protein [Sphingomicrobium sp. B8]
MRKAIFGLLAAVAATPASAQTAPPAPDYSNPDHWICLPGRADLCGRGIEITPLTPDGWGRTGITRPAAAPPIDCFYVYPTISSDPGMNADLTPSSREEYYVTQYQFTRFPEVCRPFVPVYRQMTMSSIAIAATGGDVLPAGMLAYGDVADAFDYYLEHHNQGRPFVLVGHSQGAIMLDELIANKLDQSPARDRLVRAYLAGWNIGRAPGSDRPARYSNISLCRTEDDIGCVVTWSTYAEGRIPPAGAQFGRAPEGMANSCVHPGDPGAKGWAPLDGFFYARSSYPTPGGPVRWSSAGAPPSAYISGQDFLLARCREDGNAAWLEVRLPRGPGDKRTSRIGGEVGQFGIFLPGWGKHLYDISIAHGSIVSDLARLGSRADISFGSSSD